MKFELKNTDYIKNLFDQKR
jgi:hypothetical protein